jgi:MoaA/NifB/PqqE/SkfB family radical SAM enzyme
LRRNAEQILLYVNDIIVSLDGDEATHNRIRNIPGAFKKLKEGVQYIKGIDPVFKITARTVIHRLNFRHWDEIINAAKEIGVDQISFLPADVSSHAFNREVLWSDQRQHEILPEENELTEMNIILEQLIEKHREDFAKTFIAESPEKLRKIYSYYSAFYGKNPFPYKKCNAPWVSAVIEADGTVRPCFFHPPMGNIRKQSLNNILNSEESINFRKELDINNDVTCNKCVCYLNLSPGTKLN